MPPRPGIHPDPPADLSQRPLPLVEQSGPWYRLYPATLVPLRFGAGGSNRFDAPRGEFGILYAGQDAHCAFIETFGQSTGINVVTTSALRGRDLALLWPACPLSLVDLTGEGLPRLGADERPCAGEHAVAQRWALALWAHPAGADGLIYRARHDPSRRAVALFDRCQPALTSQRVGNLLDPSHVASLAAILDTYGFGLVDDRR